MFWGIVSRQEKGLKRALETETLSAREIALRALRRLEEGRATGDRILEDYLRRIPLPAVERSLAMELTFGVQRWRGRIDWILERVYYGSLNGLTSWIRNILRLGAYQLFFQERVPASAAVNEAVKLAHRHGHRGTAGLVNALLREADRRREALRGSEPGGDPVHALSVIHSHPEWLVRRWIRRWGIEKTEAVCTANNRIPPVTVRISPLKIGREEVFRVLAIAGIPFSLCSLSPVGIHLGIRGAIAELPAFQQGFFSVQDEGAMLVAPLLDPRPGERILELCAAPGGKTTHLGEMMGNEGEIIAVDRSRRRLKLLEENCRRLGLTAVRPLVGDVLKEEVSGGPWPKVLVDAPCSNLGMLRRNPDARWLHAEEDLVRLPAVQLSILERAGNWVSRGGILVYATCSTEEEENERVVSAFLARRPDFRVEPVTPFVSRAARKVVTGAGHLRVEPDCAEAGGIFAVRLRRN